MHALTLFLLFFIVIQSADLAIFSWYLARKQANVSGVVRLFALVLLWGIAALLTLEWVFGVSVVPLLATSTVLSAILGLALQDTLRNLFAGLNMSMEKSFVEGDWVSFRLDASDQWFGQIVEIGWRTTKIKTLNNNYAIIPNSNFTNHELINFSKPNCMHARTLDIPVNTRAEGASVRQALIQSAASTAGILQIKNDCVVYQLRFWIDHPEHREDLTGDVLERSWQELKELGALP
jgi:small-conductance mechanosensitive channel